MANKFLGLDNVNVLIDYIDKKIKHVNENTRVLTIQAYRYEETEDLPARPHGGGFDLDSGISYPEGWNSLYSIMNSAEDVDTGNIWMSAGVVHGTNEISWSVPISINGLNGTDGKDGIDFRFSYDEVCAHTDREVAPPPVLDENNKRVVYYWIKPAGGEWPADDEPGNVWTKYTTDGISANQIIYRYRLTSAEEVTVDADGNTIPIAPAAPTGNNDSNWTKTILNATIDKNNPYLWMSTANIVAGTDGKEAAWSEPILFSSLGQDGKDGNVPDYTITLYCKGAENDGLIKPDAPVFVEDTKIDEYKVEPWTEVPTEETGYWWQCTFKVKGLDNTVLEIGDLKRYNGVDGEAQPGEWTEICFCWSETQDQPALNVIEGAIYPEGWSSLYPSPAPLTPEPTLWMTLGRFNGMNEDGTPKLISEWSEPVRMTGPAGPLNNDCRLEMRYAEGSATTPNANATWEDDPGKAKINNTYMYLWVKPYLVYYKMKYADTPNEDGSFDIEQVNPVPDGVIKEFTPYRASGLNGDNGNIKNKVAYNINESSVNITSFANENMYIYNGSGEITYNINYNLIDFETGYTGKFSNVGTGTVKVTTVDPYEFVGSGKAGNDKENTIREISLSPQESVELVCYKSGDLKQFIVIGKTI